MLEQKYFKYPEVKVVRNTNEDQFALFHLIRNTNRL